MTGYERSSGRFYRGKLATYGETVLGCLKTRLKGLPQWKKGIWLGKTLSNDCHIIGTASGIFITRSIRRLPDSFHLDALEHDVKKMPQICHHAVYQHPWLVVQKQMQMSHQHKLAAVLQVLVELLMRAPPPELTANWGQHLQMDVLVHSHVQPKHPFPASSMKIQCQLQEVELISWHRPDDVQGWHIHTPMGRLSNCPGSTTEHDDEGADPKRLHGDAVPQTLQSEAGQEVLDDTPLERMMSPNKSAKHGEDPSGINLLGHLCQIEHLGIEPEIPYEDQDLDTMLQHDLNLKEDPEERLSQVAARLKELSFP